MICLFYIFFRVIMTSHNLLDELKNIYDSYADCYNIYDLYRMLSAYNNDIKNSVSLSLYESWQTEMKCLYNESIYGDDGSDTEYVIKDCIDVLKEIIDELSRDD